MSRRSSQTAKRRKKFNRFRKRKVATNKKVKNATVTQFDGQQFRSRLEAYTAQQLTEAGIPYSYEAVKFTLMESFRYDDELVRAITYKPDFTPPIHSVATDSNNWIIEVKGFATDSFKLRWKLFKKYLYDNQIQVKLYLPRNQRDVREMIQDILNTRRTHSIKQVTKMGSRKTAK